MESRSSSAEARTTRGTKPDGSITASHSRPSSADRSPSRSPSSFSASGKSSGFVWPRLKSVTSSPRARAASTTARPRNFVPPRTSSLIAATLLSRRGGRGAGGADGRRRGRGLARLVRAEPRRRRLAQARTRRHLVRLRARERRRVHALRDRRPRARAGAAERALPRRERPGGLPRALRRVPADRRGRGAAPEGLGLLPLRPRDVPHLRRRRRGPVRDPDGGGPRRGQADPLPAQRAGGAPRRLRAGGDDRPARGLQGLGRRIPAGTAGLAGLIRALGGAALLLAAAGC